MKHQHRSTTIADPHVSGCDTARVVAPPAEGADAAAREDVRGKPPNSSFGLPLAPTAPVFGKKPRPSASYAIEFVKKRLRELHRAGVHLGETAAFLYLLLATYVLNRNFETSDIELADLARVMHCESPAIRQARRRLEKELGEIKQTDGGRGKRYVRFAFERMGGPLLAGVLGSRAASPNVDLKDRRTAPNVDLEDRSARGADYVRTEVHIEVRTDDDDAANVTRCGERAEDHHDPDPTKTAKVDKLDAYFNWRTAEYDNRYCNRGIEISLSDGIAERQAAAEVLRRFSDDLEALTIELWDLEADPTGRDRAANYIATRTDRSIFTLRRFVDYLHRRVQARRAAAQAAPSASLHDTYWPAVRARLAQRLTPAEIAQYVEPCQLAYVHDGVARIDVPSMEFDQALETTALVAAADMSMKRALYAAVCTELHVTVVRYWYRSTRVAEGECR